MNFLNKNKSIQANFNSTVQGLKLNKIFALCLTPSLKYPFLAVTTLKNIKWINNVFLKQEEWYGYLKAGTKSIPHYKKMAKGGEDASYESENLLIVADGVGGWNDLGIDPSKYSKSLCKIFSKNFEEYEKKCQTNNTPLKINEQIVKQMLVKSVHQNKELGSSTVCVLIFDKNTYELYSAYLGDSCYMIARPKDIGNFELFYKAKEDTHGFNFPRQVGTDGDNPNEAIINKHKVEKDDLIIAASDGLWDNLEDEDILKEINSLSEINKSIVLNTKEIAKKLSEVANELSTNPKYYSPFARRASESKYKNYMGGKPDDITVIVAQVLGKSKDDEEQINPLKRSKSDNSSSSSTSTNSD